MKPAAFAFWFLLFFGLLTCVSACKRGDSQANPQANVKRNILCVVYPEADIVRQVAGDQADLRWQIDWFCENGQDPRNLEITDDRRQLLRRADLIISGGFPDVWLGNTLTARIGQSALSPSTLWKAETARAVSMAICGSIRRLPLS